MPPEMKRSNVRFALLLPLFFMVMFPLCYITALHMPALHHLPVAVVGAGAAGFIAQAGPALAGRFDLVPVATPGQAIDMIFNQTVKVAYVPAPSGQPAQMFVAGADGRLMSQLVPTVFRPIAGQFGSGLQVHDIAPLAAGDANGIGLMFFMLISVIVGFMAANILGNAAFFLAVRTRLAICAGIAVLAPVVLWVFMGPWMRILVGSPGQVVAVLAIAALTSFTVALFTTALVAFLGKWALFPAMLVFIFLNIPSSNSAYPAETVPPFFGWVSHFHLGAAMVDSIRQVLYLHDTALAGPMITIVVWFVIAAVVMGLAVAYRRQTTKTTEPSDASTEGSTDDAAAPIAEREADPAAVGVGPGRALRGHIHDHHDTPVPGAVITVIDPSGTQVARASTGTAGSFRVDDLAEGSYTLIVSAPGHQPAARTTLLNGHPTLGEDSTDDLGTVRLAPRAPG